LKPRAVLRGAALGAAVLSVLVMPAPARGHEMRPAFASIIETADGVETTVSWPVTVGAPGRIAVQLPGTCEPIGPPVRLPSADRIVENSRARCKAKLRGATLAIEGLTPGVSEIVVRAELVGAAPLTLVARREQPSVVLGEPTDAAATAWTAAAFVRLGVRHILEGADHLLFVLGLLLLVAREPKPGRAVLAGVPVGRLAATVTAFTLAHTLTLGLATTGAVVLPPRGVEAAIALSILAVAVELTRERSASTGATGTTFVDRGPWAMAFAFGLLHGFGFAGGLRELGLPREALPAALLFFNVGVELGQLAFLAVCVLALAPLRHLAARARPTSTAPLDRVLAYGIGSLAAYWFLARALAIFGRNA
jgi:hypothetical protein